MSPITPADGAARLAYLRRWSRIGAIATGAGAFAVSFGSQLMRSYGKELEAIIAAREGAELAARAAAETPAPGA